MVATLLTAPQALPDTLESPLPGGVSAPVRGLFNLPSWIQVAAIAGAALVALFLVVLAFRRRRAIGGWIASRPIALKLAMVGAVIAAAAGAGVFGVASWNYTQHSNDFCTGCHVMTPAFERFTKSAHSELACHDCHQQPLSASLRQLYLWVKERPQEIGPHAKVPDAVCRACHVRQDADSTWQRVADTPGHRIHLTSDSAALADVRCVTCHGVEVHSFVPAETTCGQTGCHEPVETRIRLGAMTGAQTSAHCLTCHRFTADPDSVPRDERDAAARMRPTEAQCRQCHEMEPLVALAAGAGERDPHHAVCGDCHDPHSQRSPADAARTCANAGCHENPAAASPFHQGLAPSRLADCVSCHVPHTWVTSGRDCTLCHGRGGTARRSVVRDPKPE